MKGNTDRVRDKWREQDERWAEIVELPFGFRTCRKNVEDVVVTVLLLLLALAGVYGPALVLKALA